MVQIPETHIDLLDRPIVVTLSTVMPNGQPQSTPIWADTKDGVVRVNTVAGRQKYKNLVERPMATVLAIDPENPMRWMELRGKVVFESEGDERTLIDKLAVDYTDNDSYPWHNDADQRVTFHIDPERIVTSG